MLPLKEASSGEPGAGHAPSCKYLRVTTFDSPPTDQTQEPARRSLSLVRHFRSSLPCESPNSPRPGMTG